MEPLLKDNHQGKKSPFVPCRYGMVGPEPFDDVFKDINKGWEKTDDGLYNPLIRRKGWHYRMFQYDRYIYGLYGITGMRIKDNALFLETGRYPELVKVVDVPANIKKSSREKWLKGVAYTLISDPDNIGRYIRFVPTFSRIDIPVCGEVLADA